MRGVVVVVGTLVLGCGGSQGPRDHRSYCPSGAPATTPATVSTVFTPGVGIGGVTIGVSKLDDVVRAYGCDWRFKWTGVNDAKILMLSDFQGQPNRPSEFYFDTETDTVKSISFGVYNDKIVSPKGNGIHRPVPGTTDTENTPIQAFIEEFGQPTILRTDAKNHQVAVSFPQGLEIVHYDTEPHDVLSITIVKPTAATPAP